MCVPRVSSLIQYEPIVEEFVDYAELESGPPGFGERRCCYCAALITTGEICPTHFEGGDCAHFSEVNRGFCDLLHRQKIPNLGSVII